VLYIFCCVLPSLPFFGEIKIFVTGTYDYLTVCTVSVEAEPYVYIVNFRVISCSQPGLSPVLIMQSCCWL